MVEKEGEIKEMGRKRIPPEELVKSICINLKQKILDEIAKDGVPKKVIEEIITQKYSKE